MKYLLPVLSLLLFIPNICTEHLIPLPENKIKAELFDPQLAKSIRDMRSFENFTDSTAMAQSIVFGSEGYANLLSTTIRMRFFHSYSHYNLSENWMAAIAGRFFWYDLSAIVIPDDILKYPMAACSQQSIILMDLFHKKGIPYRKIGFDHHFTVEAFMDNRWIYFDPDLEPEFLNGKRTSFAHLLEGDNLQELYKNVLPPDQIPSLLGNPFYGKINEPPAPRANLFHRITTFFSHWLWIIPLLLYGYIEWKMRMKKPCRSR